MPSLLYYLRRAREQSLLETLNLGRSLVANRARAGLEPTYDRFFRKEWKTEDLLTLTGFKSSSKLAEAIKGRPWPDTRFETPVDLAAANSIRLRSWHTDLNSGYTWDPRTHFRQIPLRPKAGVD